MMSPGNEKQAMIPEGTRVLSNQVGTAPGVLMTVGKSDFYFLPGVPKELHRMFEDFVMPRLAAKVAGFFCEKTLRCFGIPEADIGDRLKDVELCGARLSYRIKFPEVLLKLTLRGEDRKKVAESAVIAAKNIRERIGNFIYGEGDAGLPAVVGGQLASHGFSIAIAESCTGGLVSSMMTDVAGSSEYFERGVISYSNKSKIELLGISEEILKAHGAVSAPTAISMAREIKRISGTDLGLSVTGIAGPGGGTPEKPVGLVFVGLASPDGIWAFKYNYNCDRLWFKSLAAATALDLVRRYFLECLPNDRQVC
jgi:nicotinamide-nucleotide amidase